MSAAKFAPMEIRRSGRRLNLFSDGKYIGEVTRLDGEFVEVRVMTRYCDIAESPRKEREPIWPPPPPPPPPRDEPG